MMPVLVEVAVELVKLGQPAQELLKVEAATLILKVPRKAIHWLAVAVAAQ